MNWIWPQVEQLTQYSKRDTDWVISPIAVQCALIHPLLVWGDIEHGQGERPIDDVGGIQVEASFRMVPGCNDQTSKRPGDIKGLVAHWIK